MPPGQVLGTDGLGEVSWVSVSVVPKDADADTRVEVEALNDEDIIRLITRNNDGLIVDSVGHVGIGMAVPPARLSVAGGLLLDGAIGSAPSLGPGNRFMWIPDKAALRAGAVNGNQWQPDSIGFYSSVTGGLDNKVKGQYSTITGGQENVVLERWSAVGGGKQNTVKGQYSVISGGQSNEIDGSGSVIAGGNANYSEGSAATVSGG